MDQRFKQGIEALLGGGSIAFAGNKYRIRDKDTNPILTIRPSTMVGYLRHCKKVKGVFVINKKRILSYHGNSWIKKRYKQLRKSNRHDNKTETDGS